MSDSAPENRDISTRLFDISLFRKRGNRTTQLIGNSDDPSRVLSGQNRWFEFKLDEPLFVESVQINTQGYSSFDTSEFEYTDIGDKVMKEKLRLSNDSYTCRVNKFIRSFRFRPDKKWFSDPKIVSVLVSGYTKNEFEELEKQIGTLDEREALVDKKYDELEATEVDTASRLANLNNDIQAAQTKKEAISAENGSLQAQQEKLTAQVSQLTQRHSEIESKISDENAVLDTRRGERRDLRKEIETQSAELSRIKQEIRLFPSEISGFVSEGSRGIRNYILIGIPFLFIIAYVTYSLFSRSIDLTNLYRTEEFDVWAVFLTRLPFVLVPIAILQVCGIVLKNLIGEIVQINRQRLALSKLSIIAKDVTTASASDLDLNDDQIFEYETHLKMELLREYMKDYIGSSYSYRGGKLTNALDRLLNRRSDRYEDVSEEPTEAKDAD